MRPWLAVVLLPVALLQMADLASGQSIGISGVADRTVYTDTVTLRVTNQPGFRFLATLDGGQIPLDVPVVVNRPDYHELLVRRTNDTTLVVATQLVRFIVSAGARGSTEWGLPPHTPQPAIPSATAEFAGGRLRVMAPQDFPAGHEIPVVAWVVDADGHALRVNGALTAPGQKPVAIKRGVGSELLAATNAPGALDYASAIGGLSTNKTVTIEAATTWTTVGGVLGANVDWPEGSRIHVTGNLTLNAGATLTIGAGSIIRLNNRIDFTNNGSVVINGTFDRPVVFMPTNRAQPWGGFLMRGNVGTITGTGVIFTGAGAEPDWFGANGNPGSHRDEQALFFCQGGQTLDLTDAAAIYLAGQLGHSVVNSPATTVNLTRFLMQRCTTGGEYTGANFTVNDSAFIECPDDSTNFVDGDNDGLYLVSGTHGFTNTLFGWVKDDGIDSGGDGVGTMRYHRCWFEATFHEGNSLSGAKTVFARDTVYIDCGQGLEDGYGSGSGGPRALASNCLFTACQSGARFGDNYASIGSGHTGFFTNRNCIAIFNHRDLFARTWAANAWTNEVDQTDFQNNFLTAPDPAYPNNFTWNPGSDGWRLGQFMTAPGNAAVGVGLSLRTNQFPMSALLQGVPVRLSTFTTNPVVVQFTFASTNGPLAGDTLAFAPGETVKRIVPSDFNVADYGVVTLTLDSALGGDITGVASATFTGTVPVPTVVCQVPSAQMNLAALDEGVPVSLSSAWSQDVGVDYSFESASGPLAGGTLTFTPGQTRLWVYVAGVNPQDHDLVRLRLSNVSGATLGLSTVYFVRTITPMPATNTILIPRGAVWRWRALASDAGPNWKDLGYNDTGWGGEGPAQLGFGDGDENTPITDNNQITSYFRHRFNVADVTVFTNLALWLLRDDGGVAHLNGVEIFRSTNMPAPPAVISYSTLAMNPTAENAIDNAVTNRNALVNGTNILAVEIHQQDAGSSDVSFDFELIGVAPPPASPVPSIYSGAFDGQNILAWGDPTWTLVSATNVDSTVWTPVPGGSSPYPVNPVDARRFFRLRR